MQRVGRYGIAAVPIMRAEVTETLVGWLRSLIGPILGNHGSSSECTGSLDVDLRSRAQDTENENCAYQRNQPNEHQLQRFRNHSRCKISDIRHPVARANRTMTPGAPASSRSSGRFPAASGIRRFHEFSFKARPFRYNQGR